MKCGSKELELDRSRETDRLTTKDFQELFEIFTADISNKKVFRGPSLQSVENFPKFDLIFHDGAHDYHTVYADLNHWLPKLKDEVAFIIDDYEMAHFPEVVAAVDKFVSEHNLVTKMITGRNILVTKY